MRIFLSLFIFQAGCTFTKSSLSQKIVLDVNGKQLTAQQFAQELAYRLKDHDALSAKDPKVVNMMKDKIAQEFIVQTLSEEWAREQGIIVKAEDLDEQVKSIQKNYPDDLAFQQALAEEGITFKAWRDRLQNTLLQKLIVKRLLAPTEEPNATAVLNYYNEHKEQFSVRESAQVRQILVATESDAKSIDEQLKHGKHMTELAKKYSISPEGPQGGMVG
jgi:peptidyl-prolyl cis-trans isomerase C